MNEYIKVNPIGGSGSSIPDPLVIGTIDATTQLSGKGTATNDSAPVGYIGEVIESVVSSLSNLANSYGDYTSITLTAGDWEISTSVEIFRNLATFSQTNIALGISTTPGNSATGINFGTEAFYYETVIPVTFTAFPLHLPSIRRSISSTTTFYAKRYVDTITAGTAKYKCKMIARRMR